MKTTTKPPTIKPRAIKPATARAHELLAKLQALADRGINGERDAAQRKVDRLKKRFDFSAACIVKGTKDMFYGSGQKYHAASEARFVAVIDDSEIATFAKWAIENRCKVSCVFRGNELFAYATDNTTHNLKLVVSRISESFSKLWTQYGATPGANAGDRRVFIRGCYDGMMQEICTGELLPTRAHTKPVRAKKKSVSFPAGIAEHPYTIAAKLGQQIALSVPLPEIEHQLERAIKGELKE